MLPCIQTDRHTETQETGCKIRTRCVNEGSDVMTHNDTLKLLHSFHLPVEENITINTHTTSSITAILWFDTNYLYYWRFVSNVILILDWWLIKLLSCAAILQWRANTFTPSYYGIINLLGCLVAQLTNATKDCGILQDKNAAVLCFFCSFECK